MTMTTKDVQKWEGVYVKACARADRWRERYLWQRQRRLDLKHVQVDEQDRLRLHERIVEAAIGIRTEHDDGAVIQMQPLFDALEELQEVRGDSARAAHALPPDGQEPTGTARSSG